jgi:predicted Abi (CAAX) family protease
MKLTPQSTEGWERFWLISFGTVVLGLAMFFTQFSSKHFVRRAYGEWPEIVFLLITAALGIYSAVMLRRGRIKLAVIGFAIFAVGTWGNRPTL